MSEITKYHIELNRLDANGNLFILYPKNTLKDVYTSSTSGVTIEGKVNFFGTCDTAADTASKTATIAGFSLIAGAHLTVVFTNGISVASATLNVNGSGAKEIYFEGAALKANAVRAKARVHMVYDGNYFHVLSGASNAAYVSNANTTKFYLLGTPTNAAGSPGTEYFDTGVYVSTTEGQMVANTMQANTFYLGGTSASISSSYYTGQAATVGTISGYLVDSCASANANGVTTKALTANQGYLLQNQIDTLKNSLNTKANSNHTHDDRYYTESEINTKLNAKANSSHTHSYAGSSSAGGSATSAISVVDYGDTSKTIKIGFAGAGATTSNLGHIAGYLTGGTQIKDVSKSTLQSWLGLGSAAYSSGKTVKTTELSVTTDANGQFVLWDYYETLLNVNVTSQSGTYFILQQNACWFRVFNDSFDILKNTTIKVKIFYID